MPYRSDLDAKDRSGAIAAVVAIHAALLFAFVNISGVIDLPGAQDAIRVFDINPPEPPPPPPRQTQQPRPKEEEGGAAPENIRSQATPVVAPKPEIQTRPLQPIAATETPRQGTAPTQGAANVPGSGTGAGGIGTGTGSGSGGTGPGGGGDNGVAYPPRLITPDLRGRDFPRQLLDQWPRGAQIFLRLRIDPRGFISECAVDRGTGNPAIDSIICNLAHDRLRFRPALNRFGQPVAGWVGYRQTPPR